MNLVTVQNVSKKFRVKRDRRLLRDHVRNLLETKPSDGFYALRDVSFTVREKESVGILGANGAGKSTLLSLIAGLALPDEGKVELNGRLAALLEFGAGFHPDLTGRENLTLNAALFGMNEEEVRKATPGIIEFAELGQFIDQQLRTYSNGMVVRLAFSVAINVEPSLILVDEVLAVGDVHFQKKSFDRLVEMRDEGRTFLIVSHAPQAIEQFCERAIWLHHGQIVMDAPSPKVVEAYTKFMAESSAAQAV